ncbi:hypothetical protein BLNAU_20175 [Blattamonas nauphoetae]|uniref:Uncharacterized protein n=1 Tax=Blattamonas nauphoetae TaxID=2049346 RepID=A0ABQ9WZF2_9EUKA|nr:hypothetical protein BLNAU_20175 [Blattamonas nauphoetae]
MTEKLNGRGEESETERNEPGEKSHTRRVASHLSILTCASTAFLGSPFFFPSPNTSKRLFLTSSSEGRSSGRNERQRVKRSTSSEFSMFSIFGTIPVPICRCAFTASCSRKGTWPVSISHSTRPSRKTNTFFSSTSVSLFTVSGADHLFDSSASSRAFDTIDV